jgi:hypothetical protein
VLGGIGSFTIVDGAKASSDVCVTVAGTVCGVLCRCKQVSSYVLFLYVRCLAQKDCDVVHTALSCFTLAKDMPCCAFGADSNCQNSAGMQVEPRTQPR